MLVNPRSIKRSLRSKLIPPLTVGLIANPVSARDIRRIIAYAGNLQIAERANMILRLMAGLRATGVRNVIMMPENAGIYSHLRRALKHSEKTTPNTFPELSRLNMTITGHARDTYTATHMLCKMNVSAIIVLGGDGTHRIVAKACGSTPIAAISTGTNNAFPEIREPTITGLAVGLAASGRVSPMYAFRGQKRLDLQVNDSKDIALVDIAVVEEAFIGTRALWKSAGFRELFTSFGEPGGIGMSAITGLIAPVSRSDPYGRHIRLAPAATADTRIAVPIAPGLIETLGIVDVLPLLPDTPTPIKKTAGSLALDGEREIVITPQDNVTITLRLDAFQCIDVKNCMDTAAHNGLFIAPIATPSPL